MTTLATATRYEELLAPDLEPAIYDFPTLFQAEGWLARRRAKRRFELLKVLDPKLRSILKPEERVFYATCGSAVTLAEQFFVGWAAYYLNRRALVFTTERLLLVQINSRNQPLELVSQIPYSEIATVKSTWNGICQVKLQGGRKFNFQSVPRAERKFLHRFLVDVVQPLSPSPDSQPGRIEHLCPCCFTVVPGLPAACPSCGSGFKSARKAAFLSLLFPGLGDLYLGHRGFAAIELLGATFLWAIALVIPVLNGATIDPDTGAALPLDAVFWISTAVLLAFVHGMDALLTHHFAKKGHHAV